MSGTWHGVPISIPHSETMAVDANVKEYVRRKKEIADKLEKLYAPAFEEFVGMLRGERKILNKPINRREDF